MSHLGILFKLFSDSVSLGLRLCISDQLKLDAVGNMNHTLRPGLKLVDKMLSLSGPSILTTVKYYRRFSVSLLPSEKQTKSFMLTETTIFPEHLESLNWLVSPSLRKDDTIHLFWVLKINTLLHALVWREFVLARTPICSSWGNFIILHHAWEGLRLKESLERRSDLGIRCPRVLNSEWKSAICGQVIYSSSGSVSTSIKLRDNI